MIRRTLRGALWLGLLVGVVFAVAKLLRTRSSPTTVDLESSAEPAGPNSQGWPRLEAPAEAPIDAEESGSPEAKPKKTLPPWVAPEDGVCPKTHPVKAKLSSGIFQVEGNAMYQRTNPDRCYQSTDAAAADGLRPAKR